MVNLCLTYRDDEESSSTSHATPSRYYFWNRHIEVEIPKELREETYLAGDITSLDM